MVARAALVAVLMVSGCKSAVRPAPENDPPNALRLSEGTNHQLGACYLGSSNMWERVPDGGGPKRPSGTLSIEDADGGERRVFVFVGDELEVCGVRYRVHSVEAGKTPGAVVLVPTP